MQSLDVVAPDAENLQLIGMWYNRETDIFETAAEHGQTPDHWDVVVTSPTCYSYETYETYEAAQARFAELQHLVPPDCAIEGL